MQFSLPARRFTLPAVVAAFATLIAACGGPEVTLTGTVVDQYTGKPVPQATVAVGSNQSTTSSSGSFQIQNWSTRDTLEVNANGYEARQVPLNSQHDLQQPKPPSVAIDAIALRPNTLSGTVLDQYTGKPLAGATLHASDTVSATTGPDGRYTLSGVPESFSLSISAPDHETWQQQVTKATSMDARIRPTVLSGNIQDQFTGKPLAGATVKVGDATATTDAQGSYRLNNVPKEGTLNVSADGYAEFSQPLSQTAQINATLRPDVLQGTIVDARSNQPVHNATVIATTSLASSDVAYTRLDNSADGAFKLEGIPEQGFVQVLAPGYKKAVVELKQGSVPTTIRLEPFYIKSIYVTAAVASNRKMLDEYFDLIDKTELNAIVIDIKSDLRDDLGTVYYDSQVPIVKELGTSRPHMDIKDILAEAKQRGIYTIARVQVFSHDNALAEAKPEWAAKDRTTGGVFADLPGPNIHYDWLDPWNQNVWDYNIQLSVEAAQMGFDEVNYDYIRFPSLEFSADDKSRLQLSKDTSTAEERFNNIATVLTKAQRAINGAGAYLSVDVFGYAAWQPFGLIGQDIGLMAEHTDYIGPMVYPSHFVDGELGFDNPAQHPYEMVYESLKKGAKQVAGKRALLRPWLQDFTLTWVPKNRIVEYGASEVRAQIKATNDFGQAAGWILYDSANTYTEDALEPEK
ncbi:MAG TPA: putative glycoside hydrolase [Roseiflexaceae bacterium]|nr:putative glycoside hydrolase [Roseiflexaceae bacterium]